MSGLIFYILIFIIGFLGSFIGTISAGAGIIIFSGLTLLGFPPQVALATDNFGSIGFRLGSFYNYLKNKKVLWNYVLTWCVLGAIGAAIGSSILVNTNEKILTKVTGTALLILLPMMFLGKDIGVVKKTISKTRKKISHAGYFLVESWAGFFAPGSGFLELFVMTKGYGLTILEAKGTNRIPSLIADLSAFIVFL